MACGNRALRETFVHKLDGITRGCIVRGYRGWLEWLYGAGCGWCVCGGGVGGRYARTCRALLGKPEGKSHLERLLVDVRIILKLDCKK